MKPKNKVVGMLNKELEDPEFRKAFEQAGFEFELEEQILHAMEAKGWSYADLAKAVGTQKSNISRDLNGGINSATVARLLKIAEALGLRFVPLFVPKRAEKEVLPKIKKLLAA